MNVASVAAMAVCSSSGRHGAGGRQWSAALVPCAPGRLQLLARAGAQAAMRQGLWLTSTFLTWGWRHGALACLSWQPRWQWRLCALLLWTCVCRLAARLLSPAAAVVPQVCGSYGAPDCLVEAAAAAATCAGLHPGLPQLCGSG
jgi:hypothetical protein